MFEIYSSILGYFSIPHVFVVISWCVVVFCFCAALLIGSVLALVLWERKLLGYFTVRLGPNRVGPWGVFQTVADAVKLLFKEDIINSGADRLLFSLAPVIFFVPVMVVYCLVPFNQCLIGVESSVGLYLFFAVLSVSVVGILFAGWSSDNKYSLLGAGRAVSQVISYEVPLLLSVCGVVLLCGSMNPLEIAEWQSGGIFCWNLWAGFASCLIFFVCMLAELNRCPFDLPEAESELVSGYNTEYSGMKFALFFLAEYSLLFILSCLFVVLFLGGYTSVFGEYVSYIVFSENSFWGQFFVFFEQIFWMFAKVVFVIFMVIWLRAPLPRMKMNSLIFFCWKFLFPISVVNLLLLALFGYFAG